tara:strand:+ start:190 stop:396 length:207 start_codon:yes stop_codon:yes gene_type:complete
MGVLGLKKKIKASNAMPKAAATSGVLEAGFIVGGVAAAAGWGSADWMSIFGADGLPASVTGSTGFVSA